ncbi:hypothetical protein TRAPUB_2127 [Trametes pubescens]|uniref:Uncharacterized protein n=1 Tax=Trametes pubescens TaxID=154538 RepID=A0A1M2VHE7_TRAPU|nr:hypothetical protein TRAPUB_2127 [Trametes pubescens]
MSVMGDRVAKRLQPSSSGASYLQVSATAGNAIWPYLQYVPDDVVEETAACRPGGSVAHGEG